MLDSTGTPGVKAKGSQASSSNLSFSSPSRQFNFIQCNQLYAHVWRNFVNFVSFATGVNGEFGQKWQI